MEQEFYNEFGELCLRWTDEKGNLWEAIKEQVEIYGKECFEQDPEDYIDEYIRQRGSTFALPEWI